MPLTRPHANSLELSIERIRATSTYPLPGTTSFSMAAAADLDVPPIPALSYWEPDTPSPLSQCNPFLFPPGYSPGSFKGVSSPSSSSTNNQIQSDSPTFLISPRLSPLISPALSPSFMSPRTPPLPPPPPANIATASTSTSAGCNRWHSTTSSIPLGDLEMKRHESIRAMLASIHDKVLTEMKTRKEKENENGNARVTHYLDLARYYNKVKTRRARRDAVCSRDFRVVREVARGDRRIGVSRDGCRGRGSNSVVRIDAIMGG